MARPRTSSAQDGRRGATPDAAICSPASNPGLLIPGSTIYTPAPANPTPGVWHLWIAARPILPPEMRGRTKNGKPKRQPPRYPPNINERRAMHWTVERKDVEYWRGYAAREARRQGTMRALERVRISARIFRRAIGRPADGSGDGERLKPLVDGLVDAGVIRDDGRRQVEYGTVEECRTGNDHRGDGILLIVEVIAPAAAPAATGERGAAGE